MSPWHVFTIPSPWLVATIALLPPAALCVFACMRRPLGTGLAATQLLGAVVGMLFVAMTFAWDQPALIDIALALSVLGLPGAILYATFAERAL